VRGYDLRTFAPGECGSGATECSLIDQLAGGRFGLVNVDVRAPALGLLTGDLDYGKVPIEAIAFVDAGILWTRQLPGATERPQRRRRRPREPCRPRPRNDRGEAVGPRHLGVARVVSPATGLVIA
jgi:hypothetical protein